MDSYNILRLSAALIFAAATAIALREALRKIKLARDYCRIVKGIATVCRKIL